MLRHNHSEWVEVGEMETVFLGTEECKEYTVHSRTGRIAMWICRRDVVFRTSAIISISLSCGRRGKIYPLQCVQGRRTWAKPQCPPLPPPVVSSLWPHDITLEEQVKEEARQDFLLPLKTMCMKGLKIDSGCYRTEDHRYMQGHRVMSWIPFRKYIDN